MGRPNQSVLCTQVTERPAVAKRLCCLGPPTHMASCYSDAVDLNAGAALDVVLLTQPDGKLKSTDWHVVFEQVKQPHTS